MKSKYVNNLCFIRDKSYHNHRARSSYIFITNIELENNRYYIDYFNRFGKNYLIQTKTFYYTQLEVLDMNKHKYLLREIINGVFTGGK